LVNRAASAVSPAIIFWRAGDLSHIQLPVIRVRGSALKSAVRTALTKATEAGLPMRLIGVTTKTCLRTRSSTFCGGRFAHIDERFDRVELKLDKLTTRTSAVEREVGALHRNIAELHIGQAAINQRLDNLDSRLARVERRLDLVEGPTANCRCARAPRSPVDPRLVRSAAPWPYNRRRLSLG